MVARIRRNFWYVTVYRLAGDTHVLPHVRPDLLEEYVHYVMDLCFSCINELFWYGIHEGHDLEIPADYTTSAVAMALYIR